MFEIHITMEACENICTPLSPMNRAAIAPVHVVVYCDASPVWYRLCCHCDLGVWPNMQVHGLIDAEIFAGVEGRWVGGINIRCKINCNCRKYI